MGADADRDQGGGLMLMVARKDNCFNIVLKI